MPPLCQPLLSVPILLFANPIIVAFYVVGDESNDPRYVFHPALPSDGLACLHVFWALAHSYKYHKWRSGVYLHERWICSWTLFCSVHDPCIITITPTPFQAD